jgi:hypothetical protein
MSQNRTEFRDLARKPQVGEKAAAGSRVSRNPARARRQAHAPRRRGDVRMPAARVRNSAQMGGRQTEKLVPQPQEATAFGFLIWNDWPIRSSTKSITEPPM